MANAKKFSNEDFLKPEKRQEIEDALKSGSVHEEFKEIDEIRGIIENVQHIFNDQIAVEMAIEKFTVIVDEYQEQPHLFDPHLEKLIEQILNIVREEKTPPEVIALEFKLLYLLTKVRGYKKIVRLMPHEVADVEPVLLLLSKQSPTDYGTWETRYMLLLWLSMVCMIPFDMARLDSNAVSETGERRKPVMERIIDAGKVYLEVTDKSRDAAAYMLSRFMTRPDVKNQKLAEFLDWGIVRIKAVDNMALTGVSTMSGVLFTIALLFKQGKREDLLTYGPTILEQLTSVGFLECRNTVLKKLYTKLVQRLGLTYLKARVASWRYQRGSRSLSANLSATKGEGDGEGSGKAEEEEEEYDIPDEIEQVIEVLLTSLKDKDTVVRWSAAKGIGRLTGRLPQELADEVVGSLMELFSIQESDTAWHGGCLALAELGRRGLLLPHRLKDVVPVVLKALNYDEKRGNFSVGAHVRDAACYVCWAFARAYDPEEIKPYVQQIATALVIVSVFDREINVRRAASAAFQENVGRQGQFPHGIDILTTCDYFAVGNRNNAYLELSVYVAQFSEYTLSLIDHLVDVKTNHWDASVRELCSQALHNLTPKDPEYMRKSVLPRLLKMTTSIDLNQRHGAILGAAEVTCALSKHYSALNKNLADELGSEVVTGLRDIVKNLSEAKLFRGLGGEVMRTAVCTLIEKLSTSRLPFHGQQVIEEWQKVIDDCLEHQEVYIKQAAIQAIPSFMGEYYKQDNGKVIPQIQEKIIDSYIKQLSNTDENTRCGYALAIGSLPKFFVCGRFRSVLGAVIRTSQIKEKEKAFADSRKDAIKSLTQLCLTVGINKQASDNEMVCQTNFGEIYECLFMAMKDYTLDSRGDIGASVREAAMTGLQELTVLVMSKEPSLLTDDIVRNIFCLLVQQCCEKIDRTRAHAGQIFGTLLYFKPDIPNIPHKEELTIVFPIEHMPTEDIESFKQLFEAYHLNKEEQYTIIGLNTNKTLPKPTDDMPESKRIYLEAYHNAQKQEMVERINWAVPGRTFHRFAKLLDLDTYAYYVLLGFTVSVGGLTESLVKHSFHALIGYIRTISKELQTLDKFTSVLLQVFRDNVKNDRVSLPMLKMLDQLLSHGVFTLYQSEEGHHFPMTLYDLTKQEITKCGEVQKLLASIDVFCALLEYEGDTRKKTLLQLAIFLCHKFPIVRKASAGKLYESFLAYDGLVDDEQLEPVMNLLSETQWDVPVSEIRPIRNQFCDLVGVKAPVPVKAAPKDK